MAWIWILLSALVGLGGVRYLARLRSSRSGSTGPSVDDEVLRQILQTGRLATDDEDEPLDMAAAAEAEEEFWSEGWDEPEEYSR